MNQQQMRDYLMSRLGHPAVQVELDVPQLDIAIQAALTKFNQYMGKGEPRVAYNQVGGVNIPMEPGDRGLLNFKALTPEASRIYSQMDIWQMTWRLVMPNQPIGEWYSLRSAFESYHKIRGTDPDYYWDDSTGNLFVDCSSGPYDLFLLVQTDLVVTDIANLKAAYQQDFKDWALAEAKEILAEIRGKFESTIPVPGGTMQTNAATLRTEAATKKLEIETRLDKHARFVTSPVQWA